MDFDFQPPDIKMEDKLDKKTLRVLNRHKRAIGFILQYSHKEKGVLHHKQVYIPITEPIELDREIINQIPNIILDPTSYYWRVRFRRFPPKPNFAIYIKKGLLTAKLLLDLHNPSLEIRCEEERYSNWIKPEAIKKFIEIAKQLFPQYASQHPNSVWRKGAIATLKKELDEKN